MNEDDRSGTNALDFGAEHTRNMNLNLSKTSYEANERVASA